MGNKVTLKVNDRKIPMNAFVQKVFGEVIEGLVNSLDKIPEKRERIEIILEK